MKKTAGTPLESAIVIHRYTSFNGMRNWGKVYGELAIMYEGRLPD